MNLTGIGIDVVEIPRIQKAYDRFQQRFLNKILTPQEQLLFQKRTSIFFLAGRFAAKEAVKKAVTTSLSYTEIAALPNAQGKPEVYIRGEKAPVLLSLSHEKHLAVAIAIAGCA